MAVRTAAAGYAFSGLRAFQIILFCATLPLLSIFLVRLDRLDAVPPYQLIFTVIVSLPALVYAIVTLLMHLFFTPRYLPVIITDTIFSILLMISAILIGKPLPKVDCSEVRRRNHGLDTLGDLDFSDPNSTFTYTRFGETRIGGLHLSSLGTTYAASVAAAGDYSQWIGRVGGVCSQMKGAFAGTVVVAAALAVSAGVAWRLRWHVRRIPEFDDEDDEFWTGAGEMGRKQGKMKRLKSKVKGRGREERGEAEGEVQQSPAGGLLTVPTAGRRVSANSQEESEKQLLGRSEEEEDEHDGEEDEHDGKEDRGRRRGSAGAVAAAHEDEDDEENHRGRSRSRDDGNNGGYRRVEPGNGLVV